MICGVNRPRHSGSEVVPGAQHGASAELPCLGFAPTGRTDFGVQVRRSRPPDEAEILANSF